MNLFKKNYDFNKDWEAGFYRGIKSANKQIFLMIKLMRSKQKKYPNIASDKALVDCLLNITKESK